MNIHFCRQADDKKKRTYTKIDEPRQISSNRINELNIQIYLKNQIKSFRTSQFYCEQRDTSQTNLYAYKLKKLSQMFSKKYFEFECTRFFVIRVIRYCA
jgi:hypothetical protein